MNVLSITIMKTTNYGGLLSHFAIIAMAKDIGNTDSCTFPSVKMGYCRTQLLLRSTQLNSND